MLVQIGYRNAHVLKIIAWYIRYFIHIYSVVIIVFRIIFLVAVVVLVKNKFLMALAVVKVSVPASRSQPSHNYSVDYLVGRPFLFILKQIFLIFAFYIKIHIFIEVSAPKPHLIIFNKGENLFISNSVHIPNY